MEKHHVAITPDSVGGEEEITEAEIVKDSNFVNETIMPIEPKVMVTKSLRNLL